MAGMQDHCDFKQQVSASIEDGKIRPDVIVRLPGGRHVVIDAKAPLEAYLNALECQDDAQKRLKMQDHARHIRKHASDLGRKAYWEQFEPAPEFVVLFLPGENFFSAALENDPGLIEAGVNEKVLLATPTTLIALLRAVAYGWKQESLARNAREISELGRDLYKRISDMAGHWTKVGKSLGSAVENYNKAVGSLETRVLVGARKFKELQAGAESIEIEPAVSLEQIPRTLQAPELSENDIFGK
jgi:DNA recombination protein RmuC